ncbi:MAG: 3-oxoacid CoA-transferase subunit A [Dehalococcoidales bacterium]|nr:3-oxoacid CoA-transferase subunit A [Dehalococcoidales bacterium]
MNKILASTREALADIFDGAVVLCGGFGCVGGMPSTLLRALSELPVKNLTLVGNAPVLGLEAQKTAARTMKVPESYADGSLLLKNGQVSKLIASVPAMAIYRLQEPFPIVKALQERQDIEIELVPQGTLAERIRAARAGIPAFYTNTGIGTLLEKDREIREINGKPYLLEYAIKADFALIWAYKADRYGNLIYKGTSRTFNATMAGAASVTIVEVAEVVELGELDPETVVTPGLYVDRIVVRQGEPG